MAEEYQGKWTADDIATEEPQAPVEVPAQTPVQADPNYDVKDDIWIAGAPEIAQFKTKSEEAPEYEGRHSAGDIDVEDPIDWPEVSKELYGKYDPMDEVKAKWDKAGPMGLQEFLGKVDDMEADSWLAVNLDYLPYADWGEFYEPGKIGFKANRLKNNDYGPDEAKQQQADYDEVLAFAMKMKEMDYRGLTLGTQAYDALGKSTAFMGEFISSLGLYPLLKGGAKKGLQKAGKKFLKKSMMEGIESFVERKAKTRSGKMVAGLASEIGRTALFMPHRVALSHQGKLLSDTIGVTDKGLLALREARDTPALAWTKAFGGVLIENITEIYGGPALTRMGSKLKAKLPDGLVTGITDIIPDPVAKTWNTLNFRSKKIALNGILEEYGEERLSALLMAATGIDDRDIPLFDKFTQAIFPDANQALIEVGIASFYGGVSHSTAVLSNKWKNDGWSDKQVEQRLNAMSESELDTLVEDLGLMESPAPQEVMADPTARPTDVLGEIDLPADQRPYKTHNMPMRMEAPEGEVKPASAVDVMDALQNTITAFGGTAPIREGRVKKKDTLGYFSPSQSVIRVKTANNMTTASHEVGHFLEEYINADKTGWAKADSPKADAELKALGRELYGPKEPHNGYKSEGIAEYTRLFVTDVAMAEKKAPAFHKYFTETFLPQHKAGAKALAATQQFAERWKQEGSVERAKQSIADPSRRAERIRLAKDKLKMLKKGVKADWVDMLDPIRLYTLAAEKALGEPITEVNNPYLTASALRTTHDAKTEYMVNTSMIDIAGNPVGAPLSDITSLVEGKQEEFTVYLWAKRALALQNDPRGARDAGLSKADAQQIIDELDSLEFQTAAQKVYDWNNGVLNYAAQASPTFAEVVKKIRKGDSGNYVPLQREFRELTDMWAKKSAGANAQGGTLSKRLHGSGRRIKDIFPQMITNARNTVKAAHDRVVLDQMIKLSQLPGMGYLIEKVPKDMIPSHVADVNDVIKMLEKEGFEVTEREGEGDAVGETLTFFMPAQTPKGKDPIMPIYNDGKIEWFYLDKQLFEALDSMEVYRLPKLADIIFGSTSRIFRTGTTGVSAGFSLISNPLRDLPTLYVNSQVYNNPGRLFAAWFKSMGQAGLRGVTGNSNPFFDLYTRLGGEMVQPLGQDIQHTKRAARRLFQGRFSRVIDIKNWYDGIRDILQFPESAARVTELKGMMKEMGIKPGDPITFGQSIKLLNAVKQVTTDFTAAGKHARWINQIAPFFNAGIQGPRANIRAAKRNPTAFALKGLSITAATLALWYKNKDEDWYAEMPYNERFSYWYVPFEEDDRKEMARIPRPFEVGHVFASIPEALMDSWYREDPEAALAAAELFITSSVPDPLNNPLFEEMREQDKNRDMFFDSPIVSQSLIRKPEEEQYTEFTSNVAIFLGDKFGLSPNRIDHAIQGLGGSVAGDLMDLLGTGGVELNKEKELADMPIVGRLFKRGGAQGSRQKAIEEMYKLMGEASLIQNSSRNEETRQQAKSRIMLTDAVRAVSALLYVRGRTKLIEDRDELTAEALEIAQDAVEIYKEGGSSRRFKGSSKRARKQKERMKESIKEEE